MSAIIWKLIDKVAAGSSVGQQLKNWEQEIHSLSIGQARERAEVILNDPEKFRCIKADEDVPADILQLPPLLQELLSDFKLIESVIGEAQLSYLDVSLTRPESRFVRIGSNTPHVEVVAGTEAETVCEVTDGNEAVEEMGTYPSIYHWFLVTDKILYSNEPL